MDSDFDNDQEQYQDPQGGSQDNSVIRGLREKAKMVDQLAKEKAELEAQIASMNRQAKMNQAVDELGLSGDQRARFSKLAEKFVEGEPDAASLKGLAEEYGFLTAQAQAQAEAVAVQSVADAHLGATVPVATSTSEAKRALDEASSPEEAMAIIRASGLPIKGVQ